MISIRSQKQQFIDRHLVDWQHEQDWMALPSGLIVSEDVAQTYSRRFRYPIGIDLFAGAGGMSCGMMQAGVQIVAAVDSDPWSAITYMVNLGTYPCEFHFIEPSDEEHLENALSKLLKTDKTGLVKPDVSGSGWISTLEHPHPPGCSHFWLGDICKLTGQEILEKLGLQPGEVDIVAGGPPCQGFTKGNKNRSPNDSRNLLVFEFVRIALEIRSKTICMENVPDMARMTTAEGLPILESLCRILEDGDFGTYESLMRMIKSQSGVILMEGKSQKKEKTSKRSRHKKKAKEPLLFK